MLNIDAIDVKWSHDVESRIITGNVIWSKTSKIV